MEPTRIGTLNSILRDTLDELTGKEFKRFKYVLRERGKVRWGKLESADTDDTVAMMVDVYSSEAGAVMLSILREEQHNQLAKTLEAKLAKLPEDLDSVDQATRPAGAVSVSISAASGGQVSAPTMTGCNISGPLTFNIGPKQ